MNKRRFAPNDQMAKATFFNIMHRRAHLPTARANSHLRLVLAEEMQHFPFPLFLKRLFCDHHSRQSQQLAQGSCGNSFYH